MENGVSELEAQKNVQVYVPVYVSQKRFKILNSVN